MAIDTREKRASVVGINMFFGPSPTPNAAQDQEWRQEVGYGYSGILAAGAPAGPAETTQIKIVSHGVLMGNNPIGVRSL